MKAGSGPAAAFEPSVTTLFVSADLRGYIGPCGCSENMRGGIERAAFQIEHAKAEGHPVVFVDSGNALFGAPVIGPEAVPQQERKAKALAQAFTAMGLAGRAVGPLDNARGEAFRQSLGLRELPPVQMLTASIAVVRADTLGEVAGLSALARERGALFVLALVQQSFEAIRPAALGASSAANVIVAARADDEASSEENKMVGEQVKVVQVQSKGRSLLRIDVMLKNTASTVEFLRGPADQQKELDAVDQRIELLRGQVNEPMLNGPLKALRKGKLEELVTRRAAVASAPMAVPADHSSAQARFVPLEANVEQSPTVKEIVTAYDREVGLINVAWAKAHGRACEAPQKGQAGFVGSGACAGCHAAPANVWQGSKHALAYQTLETAGKNNHLDCVGCHVTGWQKPGGVCRIDQTEGRAAVGCESCHGPGSLHLAAPSKGTITRAVTAATCTGCHDRENAPHFNFETYVEKVLGPGHGR